MRVAKDSSGKTYYVPSNMDYSTWNKKYIQKGLKAGKNAFNQIVEHDEPIQLGNVDFFNKNMVLSKLKEYEEVIVGSHIENAIVISKDGIIRQCFGDLNGVYPDTDLNEKLEGAYVTHNHPIGSANEYSFSNNDIKLYMENNLEILRGIDERYIYQLSRNSEDIDEHMSIIELMMSDGTDARHEIVIDLAKKYKIGYRRWKR